MKWHLEVFALKMRPAQTTLKIEADLQSREDTDEPLTINTIPPVKLPLMPPKSSVTSQDIAPTQEAMKFSQALLIPTTLSYRRYQVLVLLIIFSRQCYLQFTAPQQHYDAIASRNSNCQERLAVG